MSSSSWIRMRVRTLFALLLLTVLASGGASAQSEVDCITYDLDGFIRECTVTEEFGQCLDATYDSYLQCIDDTGEEEPEGFIAGLLDWLGDQTETGACFAASLVDSTGCVLEMPVDLILD